MSTKLAFLLTVISLSPACGGRPDREEHFASQPSALVDLELRSEHAYARALAGDTDEVAAASMQVMADWTAVRGDVRRRGATQDVLDELDAAVLALGDVALASTDRVALGRAANRITGSLDEVFALYDPAVRSSVMELDYLGRELYLDGKAADLRHAGTHASLLLDHWSALRPELERAGDAAQVAMLGDDVAAISAAISSQDAAALATRANALVNRVYDVERSL